MNTKTRVKVDDEQNDDFEVKVCVPERSVVVFCYFQLYLRHCQAISKPFIIGSFFMMSILSSHHRFQKRLTQKSYKGKLTFNIKGLNMNKTMVLIIPGKDLDILKDSSTFLQDVGCKGANTNSIFKIVNTGLTNDVQQ